jgi:hypothetical protein
MIFVAGNSRSGTTLMGRILGKHPDIFTFNELHFLEEKWLPVDAKVSMTRDEALFTFSSLISIQRDGYLKQRHPEKYIGETEKVIKELNAIKISFATLYKEFLLYEAQHNQKKIPCEKTPRNVLYINELLKIYPECKIICMIRDPKDVLLSQKKKWKRRFLGAAASIPLRESMRARINYHPFIISKLWNTNAQATAAQVNNNRVKILSFEKLVSNAEEEIKALCIFLGISFNPEMLKVEQKGSSVEFDNTQEPKIDQTKTGNWKNGLNATEIYLCERITKNWRTVFQYKDVQIKPNYFLLAIYYLIFPMQMFIAFAVNIGRTKNVWQSIKKRFA